MRTIWIIDGSYLLKASPGKFDYLYLRSELEKIDGEPLSEAYYLDSTPNPPTDAQNGFHTWLKSAAPRGPHMRVNLYKLKNMRCECPTCGHGFERQVQKGVDVGIATLLLKLAIQSKYDRVILSAGDGDFEDAVEHIKDECGKELWVAGFDGSVSSDLQSYANKMIWLNEVWDSIKKA